MKCVHLPHSKVVNNRAVILTLNRSVDLSNTALCITTYSAESVLVHFDWAPLADAGTGRPGKRRAWQCKLIDFWIHKMLRR